MLMLMLKVSLEDIVQLLLLISFCTILKPLSCIWYKETSALYHCTLSDDLHRSFCLCICCMFTPPAASMSSLQTLLVADRPVYVLFRVFTKFVRIKHCKPQQIWSDAQFLTWSWGIETAWARLWLVGCWMSAPLWNDIFSTKMPLELWWFMHFCLKLSWDSHSFDWYL